MEQNIIRETIIRNREALGIYEESVIDNKIISRLERLNQTLSIGFADECYEKDGCEYIIADGLIVGYGV